MHPLYREDAYSYLAGTLAGTINADSRDGFPGRPPPVTASLQSAAHLRGTHRTLAQHLDTPGRIDPHHS